ncbi:MAG TPA: hypothetical protein VFU05_10680 [Cyclobacteriaceae bacterium]|nr:hypothetical protein [Cyclobacteriaceae bacterium]
MKIILTGMMAWATGLVTVLAASYFLFEIPSMIDVSSFAVILFVSGSLLVALVYLPIFHWLRRNRDEEKILKFAPLIAVGMNAPVYIILYWITGNTCSLGEALLFLFGFVAFALVFGASYSKIYHNKFVS